MMTKSATKTEIGGLIMEVISCKREISGRSLKVFCSGKCRGRKWEIMPMIKNLFWEARGRENGKQRDIARRGFQDVLLQNIEQIQMLLLK